MLTGLATPTVCKVYEVDPVGVEDGKRFSAPLGIRTLGGGVVTKLEDITGRP